MNYLRQKASLLHLRTLSLGLSFVSLVICALSATAHYLKWGWGNPGQPVGWLLSMFFLLLAFSQSPLELAGGLKSFMKPKAALLSFWLLVFVVSHLWNFNTAPWNGNGLFDESGWDLWFLKDHVIGHPYQAAWYHAFIARETLFHYFLLPFLHVFGFNILSYEAALFVIWCATFIFTLLLVDLLFRSYLVTSIAALIFNFLPFAFIYTFAGYRYPMATLLCVASLYFLHLGFKTDSAFQLSLGGIAAGLCFASSISGKQYLLALILFALFYSGLHWNTLIRSVNWKSVSIVAYGCAVAATPIICYIVFNRNDYTSYEGNMVHGFWQALLGKPSPHTIGYYTRQLWNCFFSVPGPRFFIPDVLPIPLPYYCFLLPGLVLAVHQKRYEIVLLATIPVAGAFVAVAGEHRLLLAIPFWIVLMGFTFAGLLRLQPGLKIFLWGMAAVVLTLGLAPSVQYIYRKTKNPFSIHHYAQEQVAVSRFLKNVVAGRQPANPHLERDEFNCVQGGPDAPYETLVCQKEAYSIIHLYLHDYDDGKILSFGGGLPFDIMTERDVWSANKKALTDYVPTARDLKLIWERGRKTDRIIKVFEPLRDLATEDSISFFFAGKERRFYVLNIGSENIPEFQQRVRALPDPRL